MTTREMEVQYSNLRQLWESGRMATQQFQESVSQLRMQESDGTWYQINPNDGRWLMWDGNSWIIAPQPIPKQMTASFSGVSSSQPLPFKLLFRQIMKVTFKNFVRKIPFTILISVITAVVLAFLNFYIIAFKNDGLEKFKPSDAALGLGMNPLIGSIYGGIVISTLFTILFIFLKNARQKGAGKAFSELLDIPSLISRYFHEAGPVAMAGLVSGAGMALLIGCLLNRFASLAIALGVGGLIMSSARSGMSTLISSAWDATYGTVKVQQKKEFPIEAGYVVMIGSSIGFILRAYFSTPIAFVTGLVLLGVALSLVKGGFRATATLLLMAFGIPFLLDLLAQVGMVFGHDGGAYEHVAQGKPMSTYWKSEGCQKIMKMSAIHGAATGIGTGILTTFWHSFFDTLKSGPGSMPGGKETADRTMIAELLKGSQDSSLYSGGLRGTPGMTIAGTGVGGEDMGSIYQNLIGKGTPEQKERWKRIVEQVDRIKRAQEEGVLSIPTEDGGEVTPPEEGAQTTEGEVPTSETAETAGGTEPTTQETAPSTGETKPEETAPQEAGQSPTEEKAETGKKEEEYKEEPTPTSETKPEEPAKQKTEEKPAERYQVTDDIAVERKDGKTSVKVAVDRDKEQDTTEVGIGKGGKVDVSHKADESSDDRFRKGEIDTDGGKLTGGSGEWRSEEGDTTKVKVDKGKGGEVTHEAGDQLDDRFRKGEVKLGPDGKPISGSGTWQDKEGDKTTVQFEKGKGGTISHEAADGKSDAEPKGDAKGDGKAEEKAPESGKGSDDRFRKGEVKLGPDGKPISGSGTWQDKEGDKTTVQVDKKKGFVLEHDAAEPQEKPKSEVKPADGEKGSDDKQPSPVKDKTPGSDDRLRKLRVQGGGGEPVTGEAKFTVKKGPIQEVGVGKSEEGLHGSVVLKTGKGSTTEVGVDEHQKPFATYKPRPGSTVEKVTLGEENAGVKMKRTVDVNIPVVNEKRKMVWEADIGKQRQTATIVDQKSGKGISVIHEDGKTNVAPVLKNKNFEAGPLKNVLPNITGPQHEFDDVTAPGMEQIKPEGVGVKYTTDIRNIDPTRLFKRLFGRRRR